MWILLILALFLEGVAAAPAGWIKKTGPGSSVRAACWLSGALPSRLSLYRAVVEDAGFPLPATSEFFSEAGLEPTSLLVGSGHASGQAKFTR